MPKVQEILEKNVEWIALGLAGAWVLWIAWAYGMGTPVTKQLGSKETTPSTIDQLVEQESKSVDRKINDTFVPEMPLPNFREHFDAVMKPAMPTAIAQVPINSQPGGPGQGTSVVVENNGPTRVAKLPGAVKTNLVGTRTGRSQVVVGMDGAGKPVLGDKFWARIFGFFSEKDLMAACEAAEIPEVLYKDKAKSTMTYMAVELERAEVLPNGNLGPAVKIAVLPMNLPQPPADRKADPGAFIEWAAKNQVKVLMPDFFQIVAGDKMDGPAAEEQKPVVAVMQAFKVEEAYGKWKAMNFADKARFMRELTDAQRVQLQKYIQVQDEKEKKTTRPPVRPKTPPRTPPHGGRDVQDPAILREMYAQAAPMPMAAGPAGGGTGAPAAPEPPPVQFTKVSAVAANQAGNIPVWADDDNLQPGKVYCYRMRLVVKNPVFQQQTAVADKKLAQVTEIAQEWSEWSKPITISGTLEFQFAGTALNRESVRFKVWRWQNGRLNGPQTFTVGPGDVIGGPEKTGVDYTTGWMVVDIRSVGGRDTRVTLMDEQGRADTRFLNTDGMDPRFNALERESGKGAVSSK